MDKRVQYEQIIRDSTPGQRAYLAWRWRSIAAGGYGDSPLIAQDLQALAALCDALNNAIA